MSIVNPPTQIHCDLCSKFLDLDKTSLVRCGCPNGSLACHTCKSIAGQNNSPVSGCCGNCYRKATRYSMGKPKPSSCPHVHTQICCNCRQTIKCFSSSIVEANCLQNIRIAWETLKMKKRLVRCSSFFAMMAENWGMFSQFYCQNFRINLMMNLWTQPKKIAFFQLWLLSQMNNPFGPRPAMSICSNLWGSYPHSPLYIYSQFSWRFRRFPWVRKLISRFAMLFETRCDAVQLFRQSYLQRCMCTKHRIMLYIIRYLMSQHAEIFELTM
jgi:hypothetical protein